MSSVHIRDVRKSFGSFEVLHGVTIPIEDGEFVVLVGPSEENWSLFPRQGSSVFLTTATEGDGPQNKIPPPESFVRLPRVPHQIPLRRTAIPCAIWQSYCAIFWM